MAEIDVVKLRKELNKYCILFVDLFSKKYPLVEEASQVIEKFKYVIESLDNIVKLETSDYNSMILSITVAELSKNIIKAQKDNSESNNDPNKIIRNVVSALDYIEFLFSDAAGAHSPINSVEMISQLTGRGSEHVEEMKKISAMYKRVSEYISRIEKADIALSGFQKHMERMDAGILRMRKERDAEAAEHSERLATAERLIKTLHQHEETAQAVLESAEEAFTTATRQGLAKAFSDQEKKQSEALGTWIAVLLGALIAGGALGASHFNEVREILGNKDLSDLRVVLYLLVSALFLAGPVWFAWLATKQIGQRFRLAQDYAFKAAVASAYLGYREEVKQIDQVAQNNALEQRLMASVLSRFDEQPLRLIDDAAHGSPAAEVLEKFLGATGKAADTVSETAGKAAGALGKAVDVVKDAKTKSGDAGAGDKP